MWLEKDGASTIQTVHQRAQLLPFFWTISGSLVCRLALGPFIREGSTSEKLPHVGETPLGPLFLLNAQEMLETRRCGRGTLRIIWLFNSCGP